MAQAEYEKKEIVEAELFTASKEQMKKYHIQEFDYEESQAIGSQVVKTKHIGYELNGWGICKDSAYICKSDGVVYSVPKVYFENNFKKLDDKNQ